MITIFLFIVLLALIFLSVPVGISIGMATLLTIVFFSDNIPLLTMAQKVFTSLDSFPIMAIPFFMLAGILMGKGGISKRLLDLAGSLIGFVKGGLAMMTVLACMFFSAISGSGPATVAAIGSFVIPAMKKERYGAGFASALTASGGAIGVIIPPSIPFVLFGVTGNVSIGKLFMAGILPGVLIGILLMAVSYLILVRKGVGNIKTDIEVAASLETGMAGAKKGINVKHLLKTIYDAKWALLTPVIILGGIYGSIFTPTEAAAVAIIYGFVVGKFLHKELSWKDIYDSMAETLKIVGATLYLIALSVCFAYVLNIENIPQTIAEAITSFSDNKYIVMLLIIGFLLIVGCFIDTIPAILILTPIFLPITTQVGIDPVHFGVIMVTALAIGFITPPFGANLFVATAIGKVSIEQISKSAIPFFLVMVLGLLIIGFIPFLSMYLPSLL
ncbi:TRAP transporter large permease [Bacillus gobiensis]|uniref:TRAP transporter large permease n=1 Tax=Bacillus gobiensis TaxID=1441095 RepID=UPI003D196080